jgi:hypothetical protein
MAITAQQILDKMAFDLQETSRSFGTGLWTQGEIFGYINYAISQFINDTGVVMSDNTITASIGTRNYDKPSDAGDIDRISFDGKRVRRVSLFDLTSRDPGWRSRSGTPQYYHEDGLGIISFEFNKNPTKAGSIRIFADLLHLDVSSLSDTIDIPDCWEPYIRWEALAYALQKDGEAQDLDRAAWAHKKYLFGVGLAQRLSSGVIDEN